VNEAVTERTEVGMSSIISTLLGLAVVVWTLEYLNAPRDSITIGRGGNAVLGRVLWASGAPLLVREWRHRGVSG
jgi:hypothetical protein